MTTVALTKPLLYLGIFLIGFSSAIHYYLYLRLRDIGKTYVAFNLLAVVSKDYLRNRKQYGWPTWPAYLMWTLLLCGLVVFAVGVFRL
jgi:hypothetical protein